MLHNSLQEEKRKLKGMIDGSGVLLLNTTDCKKENGITRGASHSGASSLFAIGRLHSWSSGPSLL